MKALRGGFSMSLVLKFLKAEDGATAIEYGLIAALIAGSSLPAWRRWAPISPPPSAVFRQT